MSDTTEVAPIVREVKTEEAFSTLVTEIKLDPRFKEPWAWGIANIGYIDGQKTYVDYATVNFMENFGSVAILFQAALDNDIELDFTQNEVVLPLTEDVVLSAMQMFEPFIPHALNGQHTNVEALKYYMKDLNSAVVFLMGDNAPESMEAVYLKLYLLSKGRVPLRSINLNGAFGIMPNLAWDCHGTPYPLETLRKNERMLKMQNRYPAIVAVDKFPRYLSHVIPDDNTRILDTSKVRMGAQLAAGTTVMPGASYINFNSGTEGPVMVEGRISSSVIVGAGTDIGGGASIAGVLSGGNTKPITIGKNCLLGANSAVAISFGDGCVIDLGCSVAGGTKIAILGGDWALIHDANPGVKIEYYHKDCADENTGTQCTYYVRGADLSGLNGIHYRQNSITGAMTAFRSSFEIELNADLH